MEKEEFNLSDKINLIHSEELGCDRYTCFSQKNVKEFIRLLKIKIGEYEYNDINNFIDKLAGDKLI